MDEPLPPEPANLRFLRRLVTMLTIVMIFGLIAIFAVLVIRLNAPSTQFPDTINMPDGKVAQSVTKSESTVIVVTTSNEILIFSSDGQNLIKAVKID